ncbi:hypothetical protein CQW23_03552 [Capsicum baccatum]|uniref:Uncharacterized protein n=1 Tax=Capsicum baccatum TaxID=33114 RepID=A0A2G2XC30_CAPBA|nr:hypothetical protein CQW23_03552 [Capsicum baccatum]
MTLPGVDPKEIPLPHEFILNRDLLAQLYPSFAEGATPFFTLNWSKYADFLTFRGGLDIRDIRKDFCSFTLRAERLGKAFPKFRDWKEGVGRNRTFIVYLVTVKEADKKAAIIRSALGYPAFTVGTITGTPEEMQQDCGGSSSPLFFLMAAYFQVRIIRCVIRRLCGRQKPTLSRILSGLTREVDRSLADPLLPIWVGLTQKYTVCSKGWAVRPLKRYVSWVQNVVRQFGPYPVWALEHPIQSLFTGSLALHGTYVRSPPPSNLTLPRSPRTAGTIRWIPLLLQLQQKGLGFSPRTSVLSEKAEWKGAARPEERYSENPISCLKNLTQKRKKDRTKRDLTLDDLTSTFISRLELDLNVFGSCLGSAFTFGTSLVLLFTFSRWDGNKRGQLEWKPKDRAENL